MGILVIGQLCPTEIVSEVSENYLEVSIRFAMFGSTHETLYETHVTSKWIKLIHFFTDCVLLIFQCYLVPGNATNSNHEP